MYQAPFTILREPIVANDTPLAIATRDYGSKPDGAAKIEHDAQLVTILVHGNNSDVTFNWDLYGYHRNGPALLVASGTGKIGDVVVNQHPFDDRKVSTDKYATTLVVVNDRWPAEIQANNSAANGTIASLSVPALGLQDLYLELTGFAAGTANSIGAVFTYTR